MLSTIVSKSAKIVECLQVYLTHKPYSSANNIPQLPFKLCVDKLCRRLLIPKIRQHFVGYYFLSFATFLSLVSLYNSSNNSLRVSLRSVLFSVPPLFLTDSTTAASLF